MPRMTVPGSEMPRIRLSQNQTLLESELPRLDSPGHQGSSLGSGPASGGIYPSYGLGDYCW